MEKQKVYVVTGGECLLDNDHIIAVFRNLKDAENCKKNYENQDSDTECWAIIEDFDLQ